MKKSSVLLGAITVIPTGVYIAVLLFQPDSPLILWARAPFNLLRVLPLVIGLCAYSALSLWMVLHINETLTRKQVIALLTWAFIAGVVLEVIAAYPLESFPLRTILFRQLTPLTNGYWTVGIQVQNVNAFLANYAQTMASFPIHPQRHPPGLPLLFWLLTRLAEGLPGLSTIVGPVVRPLSCLDEQFTSFTNAQLTSGFFGAVVETVTAFITVIPLFAFVRRLASDRAAAAAVFLYTIAPGVLGWVSQFDRSSAAVSITGLWLCEKLVLDRKHSLLTACLLGLLFSLAVFVSFGNLPIILLCALYTAVRIWQGERLSRWRDRLVQASFVVAGFASIWVVCILLFHFDPVGTYRTGMSIHYALNIPFWPFVLLHAWDMATFVGLPLAGIALVLVWKHAPALSLSLAATLVILSVLHVARGETGRVWLYFAPLIIALASIFLTEHKPMYLSLTTALVVIQALAMLTLLRIFPTSIDPMTVPDAPVPQTINPVDIRYGANGELQLLGYTIGIPEQMASPVPLHPGDLITLTLYWKQNSAQPIPRSYGVFLHISDSVDDQSRIASQDSMPINQLLPTTCWRSGQIYRDMREFTIAAGAKPGPYKILVGLYDSTGQRAFVQQAEIAKGGAVELPGTLMVSQAQDHQ